jgi:DNA-binding phage protein
MWRRMAKRKTSPRPDGAVTLAGELRLGSHSLLFNDDEVVQLLRAAVEREGNQGAFARRHGIERTTLNMILNGKRPVNSAVMKALGLRKVYAPK